MLEFSFERTVGENTPRRVGSDTVRTGSDGGIECVSNGVLFPYVTVTLRHGSLPPNILATPNRAVFLWEVVYAEGNRVERCRQCPPVHLLSFKRRDRLGGVQYGHPLCGFVQDTPAPPAPFDAASAPPPPVASDAEEDLLMRVPEASMLTKLEHLTGGAWEKNPLASTTHYPVVAYGGMSPSNRQWFNLMLGCCSYFHHGRGFRIKVQMVVLNDTGVIFTEQLTSPELSIVSRFRRSKNSPREATPSRGKPHVYAVQHFAPQRTHGMAKGQARYVLDAADSPQGSTQSSDQVDDDEYARRSQSVSRPGSPPPALMEPMETWAHRGWAGAGQDFKGITATDLAYFMSRVKNTSGSSLSPRPGSPTSHLGTPNAISGRASPEFPSTPQGHTHGAHEFGSAAAAPAAAKPLLFSSTHSAGSTSAHNVSGVATHRPAPKRAMPTIRVKIATPPTLILPTPTDPDLMSMLFGGDLDNELNMLSMTTPAASAMAMDTLMPDQDVDPDEHPLERSVESPRKKARYSADAIGLDGLPAPSLGVAQSCPAESAHEGFPDTDLFLAAPALDSFVPAHIVALEVDATKPTETRRLETNLRLLPVNSEFRGKAVALSIDVTVPSDTTENSVLLLHTLQEAPGAGPVPTCAVDHTYVDAEPIEVCMQTLGQDEALAWQELGFGPLINSISYSDRMCTYCGVRWLEEAAQQSSA